MQSLIVISSRIEMLVDKKDVAVDLKLETKALDCDEDPRNTVCKLLCVHGKATYLEDIADCLHLGQI